MQSDWPTYNFAFAATAGQRASLNLISIAFKAAEKFMCGAGIKKPASRDRLSKICEALSR